MNEIGNAPTPLTLATIFAQSLIIFAMADMVVAVDTAAEDRAAADWAQRLGIADTANVLDTARMTLELEAVAVVSRLRGSHAG
jgi:hypothetical protein